MENIKFLKPFTKFCCTIGNLPSSYLVSLTYEEQLLWLCNYLENTVIPTVNGNAEAICELQNLFLELKEYVDNYFSDLNVQEEINKKLDEMATDGTLDKIINQNIFNELNQKIDLKPNSYPNVNTMIEDTSLKENDTCITLGYYNSDDDGGGLYLIKSGDFISDGGKYIALNNGLFAVLCQRNNINVKQYGAKGDSIEDDTIPFQNAISNFNDIFIPNGIYNISHPLIINNEGKKIHGSSNMGVKIQYIGDSITDNKGLFTFIKDNFSWGITIEHLHLFGNNKFIHGISLKNIAYPLLFDVNIEGFNGAGLLIDKCQDGSFENCNIQLCGRTSPNGNPTNNSDTLFSPVHITSTVTGDNSNMLRFNKCQIEQNNCSPYVRVYDGIGIWFSQCHGEIRNQENWGTMDFLQRFAGDIELTDMDLSQFRNGIVDDGYGSLIVKGGRGIGNYLANQTNTNHTLVSFSNTYLGNIKILSHAYNNLIIQNCIINDIIIDTLAGLNGNISNNVINGNIVQDLQGSPNTIILTYENNVVIGNVNVYADLKTKFINNNFQGNVSIQGNNKYYFNNICLGTESLDTQLVRYYIPSNLHITYGLGAPEAGTWNIGDITYNKAPSTGQPIGWVMTSAGWKGFGIIN